MEIQWCCSTLLLPPQNNRFGLIGQLLVPPRPPQKRKYCIAAGPVTLPPHLPYQKKKPRRKPVVFNLFLTQLWMEKFSEECPLPKKVRISKVQVFFFKCCKWRIPRWLKMIMKGIKDGGVRWVCVFIRRSSYLSLFLCCEKWSTQATVSQKLTLH